MNLQNKISEMTNYNTPKNQDYQIVAVYDDHVVLMKKDAHFTDFSKRKIIEI